MNESHVSPARNNRRQLAIALIDLNPVVVGADVWETLFMPKANLRQIRGGLPFQDFECFVCKQRISRRCENLVDEKTAAAQKAAIFKEWDAHLHGAHRRQWDSEQAKKAKREAKRQESW